MSRIYIKLKITAQDLYDEEAVIGYDDNLETWFLQAFETCNEELDSSEPNLWLGINFQEYADINTLILSLDRDGVTFEFYDESEKELFENECKRLDQKIKFDHDVF